jgi:Co/Zn/Cd efflux system component
VQNSALILLETVPSGIDIDELQSKLKAIPGIKSIQKFHLWKLSGNKIIATAHVTYHKSTENAEMMNKLKACLTKYVNDCLPETRKKLRATFQLELVNEVNTLYSLIYVI